MNPNKFISGVIKDDHNPRDYQYASLLASNARDVIAFPKVLDLRNDLQPIRNQGSRGTCAAFASACVKEWQEHADSGYDGYMSPEFIYWYRANKPGVGMQSRDVMKILATQGCCSEDSCPYQSKDSGAPETLPSRAIKEAAQYVIKEYYRINTIDELKNALYQSGPCYISFPVYDTRPEFWRQKSDESLRGGHAVVVVGYNKEGFIIRNSWGTRFGDGGYVIYPYGDFGKHWDIWASVDTKGSPKPYEIPKVCCIII